MFRIRLICFLLLVWQTHAATPTFRDDPDYLIDTWELEDGLPENSSAAMIQDADGYLWVGTFAGLVRFDGVNFTEIPLPVPRTGVVNIHLDRAGRLWVSTYRGLRVREGGRWRDVTAADGWTGDLVRTFSERADGGLLVTAFDGNVLEYSNGSFTGLPPPPGLKGVGYLGAVEASGKWCVAQKGFVGTWDGAQWVPLVPADDLRGVADDAVGLASARDGGLWLLLGKQLRKLRNGAGTARITLPESPGGVWSVFEDSAGYVWISSYNLGLSRVSPDGTMRRWNAANGSYHALRFVFEDRERNVWVGTSGGGLQRFKPRRFRAHGPESGITEPNATSIAPAGSGVYVGTYGGGLFRLENGRATKVALPGVVNVQSVLTDGAGRTWVGTFSQGLWLIENGVPRRIPDGQTGGGNVIAMFEDSRGRVWLSGGQGVVVFDGEFRAIAAPQLAPEQRAGQPPLYAVTCFAEDSSGSIWLSNDAGIFRVENDLCIPVLDGGTVITGVTCLHAHRDAMWLYSSERGLVRWRDGVLSSIPAAPTAFPGVVSGVVEDTQGYWWVLTGRGVVRWREHEFMTFGLSDGLPSVEGANGRQPVCARDAEGVLWFATHKGVASIDPAQLRFNPVVPPVHFESLVYRVLRDGKEVETRLEAPFAQSPVLPADSRRIEFHFSAPCFSAPENMQFVMHLENSNISRFNGAPAPWSDAGKRRVIEFFEHPPGDFRLHVRAANNDGVWNETGASLSFTVRPHYWQTVWFRTAGVLLLLALGGCLTWRLMRMRHGRMEERLALQQQRGELAHLGRVASMSELSGSLAHELNQPLAAILSNAQAAQRFMNQQPPDLAEVRDILTDIIHEDRRAGEVIRRMRGMLKKGKAVHDVLDLNGMAEEVLSMIRSDLVARNDSVTADFAPALPPVYGDRIQLQQVILNLLLNACDAMTETPAAGRLLTVSTSLSDGVVVLCVRDLGHGLAQGTEEKIFEPFYSTKAGGLGMGLAICRSILAAHGGKLTARNHAGGGAIFRMELPAHLQKPA